MKIFSLRDLYVTKSVKKMVIIHISFYINVHRRNGTFRKRRSVWFYLMKWYHSELRYYNNETKLNDTVHRRSKLLIGKREFIISIYVNPDTLIPFLWSNGRNFTIFKSYFLILCSYNIIKKFTFEKLPIWNAMIGIVFIIFFKILYINFKYQLLIILINLMIIPL